MVDIRVGQHHRRNRARALGAVGAGMELGTFIDLLTQIGRRVEDYPTTTIGADSGRRLRPRTDIRIARASPPRCRVITIPLRETTTGSGPQYQHMKHNSPWTAHGEESPDPKVGLSPVARARKT